MLSIRQHCSIKLHNLDIHEAIQSKFWSLTKELLDKGDFLCTANGNNCFVLAARHKNWSGLLKMLRRKPEGLQCKDSECKSLLYLSKSSAHQVLELLKLGASTDDPHIGTVLACVISSRTTSDFLVMQILSWLNRVNVPMTDSRGGSLLKYCGNKSLKLILYLINLGANVHDPDFKDVLKRKVSQCTGEDQEDLVTVLTRAVGLQLKLEDKQHVSLLSYCEHTNSYLFRYLLHLGADFTDPKIKDTLRHMIISSRPFTAEIIIFVSAKGMKLEDSNGTSLISYCPLSGWNLKLLLCLLQCGADPNVYNLGKTLKELVKLPHSSTKYEIFKLLNDRNIKLVDENSKSLLIHSSHSSEQFKYLIEFGANFNIPEIHEMLTNLILKLNPGAKRDLAYVLKKIHKAGIPLVDVDGASLIEHAITSPYIIMKLIRLGASTKLKDRIRTILKMMTFLNMTATKQNKHVIYEIIKILAPAHHFFRDTEKPVLCMLLYQCILLCINYETDDSFKILKYVMINLILIGFDQTEFKYNRERHPQNALLTMRSVTKSTLKLLDIFFKSCFKDVTHTSTHHLLHCRDTEFGFLAAYLLKTQDLQAIPKLLEFGLANTQGVTALTVLVEMKGRKRDLDSRKCEAALTLLESRVNIEAKCLVLKDEQQQHFSEMIGVSDVLLAASLNYNQELVLRYHSHIAWPALSLLKLMPRSIMSYNDQIKKFTNLLNLGRVPHGTEVFRVVKQEVCVMSRGFPRHIHTGQCECELRELPPLLQHLPGENLGGVPIDNLTLFDFAHRSPLTLLELSRYAVKQMLARSKPLSLTKAYKALCPPGMADHLLDTKIESIRAQDPMYEEENVLFIQPPSLVLSTCLLPLELQLELDQGQSSEDNSDQEDDDSDLEDNRVLNMLYANRLYDHLRGMEDEYWH